MIQIYFKLDENNKPGFINLKSMKILYNIPSKLSDETRLSSDIYLPDVEGKYPVILLRTPYGKQSETIVENAIKFSNNGFIFVANDVRGRGDSDGTFVPYFNEASDGCDMIEWCSHLDQSDGNVFTWGASYSARIQWLTALKNPKKLKGIISTVSPSDPFVENPTGQPSPLSVSWLFSISGRTMQRTDLVNWKEVYDHLPLLSMSDETGQEINFWKKIVSEAKDSDFWKPLFYQTKFDSIPYPAMHVGGWYDDEQIGTFKNFMGMVNGHSGTRIAELQRMIIGSWPHNVNRNRKLGRLEFGMDSIIDLVGEEIKFIDHVLKNKKSIEKPVKLYLMGENQWMSFSGWPPEKYQTEILYLSSSGNANSRFGDGKLINQFPEYDEMHDAFTYDPGEPVLFISESNFEQIGGPDDYSKEEDRNDLLVYTSEVLGQKLTILGNVEAEIYVDSDAPDTDFTVKLLDVWPDDHSMRLLDGIKRISGMHNNAVENIESKERVRMIKIDLWNMGITIPKGHKLRVEIASSAFPKYARNLNISGFQGGRSEYRVAHQKVFHGRKYGSNIRLPIFNF